MLSWRGGERQAKAIGFAVLAACFLALPTGARAETAYYASAPASVRVDIPVSASVAAKCGFGASGAAASFDAGAIDRSDWSGVFALVLACNGPSRIAIQSRNAGLRSALAQPVAGFTALAPYTVAIGIARVGGMTAAACPAAQLGPDAGGSCAFAGTASATGGLLIPGASVDLPGSYVRVSAPAYGGAQRLVAGTYSDTLTVTIVPAT